MEDDPNQCPRREGCVTLDVWKRLADAISGVVDHITLDDLVLSARAKQTNVH
jgi:DNA-binding IscR family transcriptional regulator